jgi:hypothetical protein
MIAPAATARTAGHGLLCPISPLQSACRPIAAAASGTASRRFPGRAPLRRPHPRRRRLSPAGHEERPLPDAWRSQHRPAHGRGTRPLRRRPPHPWLLLGRDHGPAPCRGSPLPPHGRDLRLGEGPRHRWAWAPSAESVASHRRQRPDSADRCNGVSPLGPLCVFASPREVRRRRPHALRWAWGAFAAFGTPAGQHRPTPPVRPAPRLGPAHAVGRHGARSRRRGQNALLRWAWAPSSL